MTPFRLPRLSYLLASLAGVVALGAFGSGCRPMCAQSLTFDSAAPNDGARGGAEAPSAPSGETAPQDASRLVAEADIVQLDESRNWLYTISRSGTLAVVDASQTRSLTLLGKHPLRGVPFEMYQREGALLVLSNQAVRIDGGLVDPLPEDAEPAPPAATYGALLEAVDLANPAQPKSIGTLPLPGEIADSRIVGDILYVATYENGSCYRCGSTARTVVTTFDVANPTEPKQIDQVVFESAGSYATVTTTTTPWKRSIVATSERLYVGGIAANHGSTNQGVVEVIDISDPAGHLVRGATLAVSGPILSRWQMDEYDGTFRVVSQHGTTQNVNGDQFPDVDVFRIESSSSLVRVGHTTLELPKQEGLKSVRFDGTRAYAITFETIERRDPLFTVDLSDPAKPTQKGELDMPGWVFHIVPRGDRLLGLGLDRDAAVHEGALNVSLFDVSDLAQPRMIDRVGFGPRSWFTSDAQITQTVIAEDQDRIQKAFRIFADGLVTVPFSAPDAYGGCGGQGSGVQLLEWSRDGIAKRALLPVSGNPRRALRRDSSSTQEVLAISDSHVKAFDIADRDVALETASVEIGRCVPRQVVGPNGGSGGGGWGGDGWPGGGRSFEGTGSVSMCE